MSFDIPILTERDIELRVGHITKDLKGCILLAYKDARVDRRIMDKVFGPMNWKREHQLIDGQLFCTVSVWDETKGQWISKQDVGIESQTQAEKGRASDSFKRACFCWGIGVELYDSPFIYIKLEAGEISNGRLKSGLTFSVKKLEYDKDKCEYTKFVVVDNKGNVRFSLKASDVKKPDKNDKAGEKENIVDVGQVTKELGGTLTEIDDKYVRVRNGLCEVYSEAKNVWVPVRAMNMRQLTDILTKDKYKAAWNEAKQILDNA